MDDLKRHAKGTKRSMHVTGSYACKVNGTMPSMTPC